jgi:hypothetical protein
MAFDVLAHTSDAEGCSNSLLEAMALGKPVAATNVGGNWEVVQNGETGILTPPGDTQALAEAIIGLLGDPEKLRDMGKSCREKALYQFSPERMIQQYEELYEDTLASKLKRAKSPGAARRAAQETLLLCARAKMEPNARVRLQDLLKGPVDWGCLMELAAFHNTMPLLAYHVADSELAPLVPKGCRRRLKECYSQTLYKNLTMSAELGKALRHLGAAGVKVVPLKGAVLAETLYGNPGLRPMVDIDLLVQRADATQAHACLAEIGYQPIQALELANHPFHGAPLYKNGTLPVFVELHWALDDAKLTSFDESQIWRRVLSAKLNGASCHMLSPEDELLYLSYHLTKHDSESIKFLCDVAELVRKHAASLDWGYFIETARSWEIQHAVHYSLSLARRLLGAPVPQGVLKELRPSPMHRLVLRVVANEASFVSPPSNRKLRAETSVVIRALTVEGPRKMMAVLVGQSKPRGRAAWVKTSIWVAVVLLVSLKNSLAGRATGVPNWDQIQGASSMTNAQHERTI